MKKRINVIEAKPMPLPFIKQHTKRAKFGHYFRNDICLICSLKYSELEKRFEK